MAYKKEIPKLSCRCGKRAKWEIFNHVNASQGYYCSPCAKEKLKEPSKLHYRSQYKNGYRRIPIYEYLSD